MPSGQSYTPCAGFNGVDRFAVCGALNRVFGSDRWFSGSRRNYQLDNRHPLAHRYQIAPLIEFRLFLRIDRRRSISDCSSALVTCYMVGRT